MNTTPSPQPARIAVLGSGTRSPLMPPHLLELGTPEAVPELINSRLAVFAGNPYDRLVVDLAYVEMAQRAEAAGCAAIFINTYADYGIAAMRAAVSIPVVEGSRVGYLAAAAAARQAPGPVALPRTARGTLVPAIVDAYVSGALGAQAAPAAAECPVCIS